MDFNSYDMNIECITDNITLCSYKCSNYKLNMLTEYLFSAYFKNNKY